MPDNQTLDRELPVEIRNKINVILTSKPLYIKQGTPKKVIDEIELVHKQSSLEDLLRETINQAVQKAVEEFDNPEFKKTIIAIPDGCKYIEVTSLGKIIPKVIKDLPNGHQVKEVYFDELTTN